MTLTKCLVLKNSLIVPFHCITRSTKRWATNIGGSNTQNGRDSAGRRLGVKLGNGMRFYTCFFYFVGASIRINQIIVRQRGYRYWPGGHVLLHLACLCICDIITIL